MTKSMTKKLKNIVLFGIILLFIGINFSRPKESKAISEDDIQYIETNTAVNDQLGSDDGVNYYKFTMEETGYFQLSFKIKGIDVYIGDGWDIQLLDSNGNNTIQSYSDITSDFTSAKFPFSKGTDVYIKIDAHDLSYAPSSTQYELVVNTISSNTWEQEYNDSNENANEIHTNTTYSGNLYCDNDIDWYHFIVDRTGYFNISFVIPEVDAYIDDGWDVTVYAEKEEINSFNATSGVSSRPYNFKKGRDIYIKINANYSYHAPTSTEYQIKVNAVTSNVWEQEYNDNMADATKLPINTTYSGTTYTKYDVDYYKVKISKNGFVSLMFNPDDLAENLSDGYTMEVFNSKNTKLDTINGIKSATKNTYYFTKGTYYIRISNTSPDYYSPSNYTVYKLKANLKVAVKPQKVTFKSVKAGRYSEWYQYYNTVNYRITSIKDVDGYQIQLSSSKKFKHKTNILTVETKGNIGSRLASKKKYYVRARAYYETPNGTKSYGDWSNVKTVKTKR